MKLIAVLLLLVSSQVFASSCNGPAWDGIFTATPTTVEAGSPVHFFGLAMQQPVNCGTVSDAFRDVSFDFGDGQSFEGHSFGPTEVDHVYTVGNFLAVLTISAGAVWTSAYCADGVHCPTTVVPLSDTFTRSFNIVSHAPEPATYLMLLAGLGLIGLRSARTTS